MLSKAEGQLRRPSGRRAETSPRGAARTAPATRDVVERKPLGKRVATKLFSVVALTFAAALIVGTSVPASAFSLIPSASSKTGSTQTVAHGKTTIAAGASIKQISGTGTQVSRDSFGATSEDEMLQVQELGAVAGYTVNNSGDIRWPFDAAVPLGDLFGPRVAPCGGCSTFHNGTDFETGNGANVYAIAAGVVTISEDSGALGQHVAIQHTVNGKSFTSIYGHMQAGSSPLRVGETVTEGQFVGLTGSTGTSTGPHLDFEININNTPVDSLVWLEANTAQ